MDEEQLKMLDECLNQEQGLTPWELDFIDDMEKRRGRELTEKQAACLSRIASDL